MEELSREDLLYLADVTISHEQFDSSLKYMQKAIDIDPHLSPSEQNIFVSSYREICSGLRQHLKKIISLASSNEIVEDSQLQALEFLKKEVSEQVATLCHDICSVVSEKLLPNSATSADKAMYHLIVADFSRYLSELELPESIEAAEASHDNYMVAKQHALESFPKAHPLSLNITLNFTILLNDIIGKREEAIEIATSTHNECLSIVNQLDDPSDRSAAEDILETMKDNVISWSSGQEPTE